MGDEKLNSSHGLRIASIERGSRVTLMVNGQKIIAYENESVHAALTAAGIRNFQLSKTGKPRGVFCGMGICYDCLVTINNVPGQRACMTMVKDKMEIITEAPSILTPEPEDRNIDGIE